MEQVNGMFKFYFANPYEVVPVIENWLSLYGFTLKEDKNGKFYQGGSKMTYLKYMEYYVSDSTILIYPYLRSRKKPMPLDDSMVGAAYKQSYKADLEELFIQLDKISKQQGSSVQSGYSYAGGAGYGSQAGNPYAGGAGYGSQADYSYNGGAGYGTDPGNPYGTGMSPDMQAGNTFVEGAGYGPTSGNSYGMGSNSGVQYVQDCNDAMQRIKSDHNERVEKELVAAFVLSIAGLILPLIGIYMGALFCIYSYIYGIKGLNTSKRGMAIATIAFSTIDTIILILQLLANAGVI